MKLIKTCELTSGQESILFDCLKNSDKRYLIQVILCFDLSLIHIFAARSQKIQ